MGIALPAQQLLVSTLSLLYKQAQVIMTSQTETIEKPIAIEEVTKAPAVKKSKKAVKAAPTGEKTPSYQAMVKQAVVETKSRTGSSLNTVKKFVIGKFPVDAVKAPARILKAVNALVAAGELVPAAPAGSRAPTATRSRRPRRASRRPKWALRRPLNPRSPSQRLPRRSPSQSPPRWTRLSRRPAPPRSPARKL